MHTLNLKIIADHLQTILSGKSFKQHENVLHRMKSVLETQKMGTVGKTSHGQQMIQEMLSFK